MISTQQSNFSDIKGKSEIESHKQAAAGGKWQDWSGSCDPLRRKGKRLQFDNETIYSRKYTLCFHKDASEPQHLPVWGNS